MSFPATGGWDSWSVRTIRLELAPGRNAISISAEADWWEWAPDIDGIDVAQ